MKRITIAGQDYRFRHSKKHSGGAFWNNGIESDGVGDIVIGTKNYKSLSHRARIAFHEVFESTAVELNCRFGQYTHSHSEPSYLFVFNHDNMSALCDCVVDSILQTGYFKITEGMDKAMGKKKGKKGCK